MAKYILRLLAIHSASIHSHSHSLTVLSLSHSLSPSLSLSRRRAFVHLALATVHAQCLQIAGIWEISHSSKVCQTAFIRSKLKEPGSRCVPHVWGQCLSIKPGCGCWSAVQHWICRWPEHQATPISLEFRAVSSFCCFTTKREVGGSFETLYSACLMQKRQVHFVMLFRLFSPLITVSLYSMMSMLQTLTRDHDHAWSNTANYMQWARFLRALGLLGKAPTHNTIETGSAPLLYNYYPARSTSILIRKTTSANLLRSNLARICRSGSGEDAPLKPVFLTNLNLYFNAIPLPKTHGFFWRISKEQFVFPAKSGRF